MSAASKAKRKMKRAIPPDEHWCVLCGDWFPDSAVVCRDDEYRGYDWCVPLCEECAKTVSGYGYVGPVIMFTGTPMWTRFEEKELSRSDA